MIKPVMPEAHRLGKEGFYDMERIIILEHISGYYGNIYVLLCLLLTDILCWSKGEDYSGWSHFWAHLGRY